MGTIASLREDAPVSTGVMVCLGAAVPESMTLSAPRRGAGEAAATMCRAALFRLQDEVQEQQAVLAANLVPRTTVLAVADMDEERRTSAGPPSGIQAGTSACHPLPTNPLTL